MFCVLYIRVQEVVTLPILKTATTVKRLSMTPIIFDPRVMHFRMVKLDRLQVRPSF